MRRQQQALIRIFAAIAELLHDASRRRAGELISEAPLKRVRAAALPVIAAHPLKVRRMPFDGADWLILRSAVRDAERLASKAARTLG